MGVKQLKKLLTKYAPSSITLRDIEYYKGKKFAIDANLFMYRFYYNHGNYIDGFTNQVFYFLKNNIIPVYIFDGKPPAEKTRVLKERTEKKKKVYEQIENILEKNDLSIIQKDENISEILQDEELLNELLNKLEPKQKEVFKKIEELQKQLIYISKDDIEKTKELLNYLGVPVIQAYTEADPLCSYLCKNGLVDAVVSEDMDILASGSSLLLRQGDGRNKQIEEYNLSIILNEMKFTMNQFIDLCILCGCDYCDTIKNVGPISAYNFIKEYGYIENVLEIKCNNGGKYKIPNDFNYSKARDLFLNYEPKPNNFETFTIKKYNIDGLENLFSKYTKFRPETIQKKFDFLKKYHGEEIETKSKYKTSKIEDFFGKKK